jgi:hypothetical protein
MFRLARHRSSFIRVVVLIAMASTAQAQDSRAGRPTPQRESSGLGLDLFAGAGASWPAATKSFEAVKLPSTPIDFGGGVRVTGLWREMFVQVSGARWQDTGERAFVDSDGAAFPLGIPLNVKATFMDGTLGVKRAISEGGLLYFLYVGGGAGVVRYSETSPFAEAGEDLEVSKVSYHALAGVEIPFMRRLAAVVETKYRYVPHLFGEGGASAVFGEDSFGGFNAAVGVRIGFGRQSSVTRPSGASGGGGSETNPPRAPLNPPANAQPLRAGSSEGIILERAPVYLLPDTKRTPLTTLEMGTRIRFLRQQGDWDQIEFPDRQWGPRIGWIQSRFVRLTDR